MQPASGTYGGPGRALLGVAPSTRVIQGICIHQQRLRGNLGADIGSETGKGTAQVRCAVGYSKPTGLLRRATGHETQPEPRQRELRAPTRVGRPSGKSQKVYLTVLQALFEEHICRPTVGPCTTLSPHKMANASLYMSTNTHASIKTSRVALKKLCKQTGDRPPVLHRLLNR